MRNEKTTFFNDTGAQTAVLTSHGGHVRHALDSTMEARKNVVVVSTDGRRLTTP